MLRGHQSRNQASAGCQNHRQELLKPIPGQTKSNPPYIQLITEIKIHKSLSHENIVKFEHVFEDHDNVYILLEICTNQTLNELIKRRKRLTEIEVQYYLHQIVGSLIYLHQNKVIHREYFHH